MLRLGILIEYRYTLVDLFKINTQKYTKGVTILDEDTRHVIENYSVKASKDIKDKVSELLTRTGFNSQKELFEAMVTNYDLTTSSTTDQTEDMQQVRYHLSRAESIFIGLIQKNQDLRQDFNVRFEQETALHKTMLDDLQVAKTDALNELAKAQEETVRATARSATLEARNSELENEHRRTGATIDLLTRHNEELQAHIAGAEALREENAKLGKELDVLARDKGLLEASLESIKQRLEQTEKVWAERLKQIENVNRLQIEKIQSDAELRVLEMTQKLRDELHKAKDENFAKLEQLREENKSLIQQLSEAQKPKRTPAQHKSNGNQK